jgi:hypothetical protein
MRGILGVAVSVVIAAATISVADAQTIIRCDGFSRQLKGQIIHYIEIDGPNAKVDGQPYDMSETSIAYTFTGPSGAAGAAKALTPTYLSVNRESGSYFMFFPNSKRGRADGWSRPQDAGCRKVDRRF